ncbi:Putative ABC transporter [Acididesulfobacillus acetoxydans]|uniref:ABC transporter n=1 Tax=Acididesulfobacillus acetoxydans TaxID=1561005 RepID=A0A8S0XUK7_9FIRM|nr:ABC transporter ATP-binding protein [Acididesulfobacillus acetoxydans]CAA7599527.1 Putative ABC transporter [Acididesulfobacillus acetoxydans]CEJ08696.1 Oligopeptide transport ATP-binding protein AppD [Acididesulfobacillus acetoxydans]
MSVSLLEIKDLTVGFPAEQGILKAVDRVSLKMEEGKTFCLVGESGSGKSVTSLSIMRLIDYDGGDILSGEIFFHGEDLVQKSQEEMIKLRGYKLAMIFQEPMSALNPVFTVGDQIAEAVMLHQKKGKKEAWQDAIEMLRLVGIPAPEVRARQYPHELSGGMCQRVVIAMALVCKPEVLIADEPTTALDVTVQAQILDLLRQLKAELNMAILLITHDMGVAAEVADQIAVMYAGVIVEEGTVEQVFSHPCHPYTLGLLKSIPGYESERGKDLYAIPGNIPSLAQLPQGCRFHPRCVPAREKCRLEEPVPHDLGSGHVVKCWLSEGAERAEKRSPDLPADMNQGEVNGGKEVRTL